MSWPWDLTWRDSDTLDDHVRRHGSEVNATTTEAYLRSARETVALGVRFTYLNGVTLRVGYYHKRSKRFTALNSDETGIVTHGRKSENYVATLRRSDYRAR